MSNLTQNPCWKEHGNLFLDSILDLFVSSAILALQELMIYTTMVSCACQVRKNMVAMVKTTVRYLNIICVCKSRVQQFLPQTHDGVTCFTNWLHLVTWSIAKSRKGNNKIWSTYRYHSSPIHEGKKPRYWATSSFLQRLQYKYLEPVLHACAQLITVAYQWPAITLVRTYLHGMYTFMLYLTLKFRIYLQLVYLMSPSTLTFKSWHVKEKQTTTNV